MACHCTVVKESSENMGGEKELCIACKGWAADIYWNRFNPLYFCQILAGDFHQELAMPKKFADHVKFKLPPKVTLKGPSGASWTVGLTMRDDGIFFQDGWGDFTKDHGLQENDILVFKYDVGSCFNVQIYDGENLCERIHAYFVMKCDHSVPVTESTPEIMIPNDINVEEVPLSDTNVPLTKTEKAGEDAGNPVVVEAYQPGPESNGGGRKGRRRRRRRSLASVAAYSRISARKKFRSGYSSQKTGVSIVDNGSSPRPISMEEVNEVEVGAGSATPSSGLSSPVCDNLKTGERGMETQALRMARENATEGSCILVMRRSFVTQRYMVSLPQAWCSKYFIPGNYEFCLRIGEKKWSTRLSLPRDRGTGQIYTGWKEFALDNQLQEWDVCLFSLVDKSQKCGQQLEDQETILLDVSIYRSMEANHSNVAATTPLASDDV